MCGENRDRCRHQQPKQSLHEKEEKAVKAESLDPVGSLHIC